MVAVEPLARLLEKTYGLEEVRGQLIKATIRDTYHVWSRGGRFVLSIYRHGQRTPAEIAAELDLIEHLAANGLRVAPAVPGRDSARLLPIQMPEGIRYGVLFTYLPGRHLDRLAEPEAARRYGRAIGRMHALASTVPAALDRPVIGFEQMVLESIDAFAAVVPHRSDDIVFLREAARGLWPRIEALPTEEPVFGLIHGDVIPSNAQVMPEGEVALLDFDFCGYGWRVYDVATFRGEMRFWGADPATFDAFLAGYAAVRPLAEWERAALPLLEAARHVFSLGTPARHVGDWGCAYLSDRLIDTLLGALRAALSELG